MRRLSLAKSPYYHYLEEDGNFRRWVEALERGSITAATNYFRKIAYGCEQLGTTPEDLTKMDAKQAKFFIHDLISHFEKKGAKGSSIEAYVKSMKSWTTWNDIETPKSIRVYGASDYNKYENEGASHETGAPQNPRRRREAGQGLHLAHDFLRLQAGGPGHPGRRRRPQA
jgi:hypothetical protein